MNSELQRAEPQTIDTPRSEAAKPRASDRTYAPRVDVVETGDGVVLYADLPGVKPGDVSLTCEGDALVLHARCAPRHAGRRAVYAEYGVGDFRRAFRIAEDVDAGKIEAALVNGVLTVRLPKAERAKPRRIAVTGG